MLPIARHATFLYAEQMHKLILLFLVLCPSAFATTIIPFEREISRIHKFAFTASNNETSDFFTNDYVGDEQENLYSRGFGLQNVGPNEIVTTSPVEVDFPFRIYTLISTDKSRLGTYLWITDYNGSGKVSDFFETMLVFLPRENQMYVEESGDQLLVTLTTGEEVVFSKNNITILEGILKEAPVDLNPNPGTRRHAQITYTGKGLIIRSDAKGADPRLVDHVKVIKSGLVPCRVPAKVFWTQEGFPEFKFVTDEEAYAAIAAHCGKNFLP